MEEQQRNEELEAEEEEELNKRQEQNQEDADSFLKFDFLSVLSKPKVFHFFFPFRGLLCFMLLLIGCVHSGLILCFLFILQNFYRILEVDYDATDDVIRSNYIRLALVGSLFYPFFISVFLKEISSLFLVDVFFLIISTWIVLTFTFICFLVKFVGLFLSFVDRNGIRISKKTKTVPLQNSRRLMRLIKVNFIS